MTNKDIEIYIDVKNPQITFDSFVEVVANVDYSFDSDLDIDFEVCSITFHQREIHDLLSDDVLKSVKEKVLDQLFEEVGTYRAEMREIESERQKDRRFEAAMRLIEC